MDGAGQVKTGRREHLRMLKIFRKKIFFRAANRPPFSTPPKPPERSGGIRREGYGGRGYGGRGCVSPYQLKMNCASTLTLLTFVVKECKRWGFCFPTFFRALSYAASKS